MKRIIAIFLALIMLVGAAPIIPTVSATTSADLSISEDGIAFICAREGFSPTCYSDVSQSSIGYGTKCTGSSVQPHASGLHSITRDAAKAEMRSQINDRYAPRVRQQTTGIQMNQNQFDALVSLCYNTGGGTSIISNSPLVKYLKGILTEAEARSQYANYYVKSGGSVLQGLINRRKQEAELFFKDVPTKPEKPIVQTNSSSYSAGSAIQITWNAVANNEYYWINIFLDGTLIIDQSTGSSTYYTLTNASSGSYVVYVSANNSAGTSGSSSCSFRVTDPIANLGDDFYGVIFNTKSWKPVSMQEDSSVTLQTEIGDAKQKWHFVRQSDGAYVITSCYDGKALEMTNGVREASTPITTHDYQGSAYQRWYIIPQGNDTKRVTFEEFFGKKLYTSYLIGDSNMYDRMFTNYVKTEAEVRQEQSRVATELLDFEQDLWEY